MIATTTWEPPAEVSRQDIVRSSDEVLSRSDLDLDVREEIFRISVLGLDWDIGGNVYQPRDPARVPRGADGRKIGAFLLHGGGGDHRGMEPLALLLAAKLGWKVATMSYPGQLYLSDASHDWPGDTINPDGTARTPIYLRERPITPDQYDLVQDRSDQTFRAKYGTLMFLKAKEGSDFYDRLAAWPAAFEEGMRAICGREFPAAEFSIYVHGHSTGGPFVHALLQRVENVAGLIGMESSPFGAIFSRMLNQGWLWPFNYITVRTWRDVARYAGPEAGAEGMQRLPWLMEDVFAAWEQGKQRPNIKAQHTVQFAAFDTLESAARYNAHRLRLNSEEAEALVQRFHGYPRELSGAGAKPVPPLLYGLAKGSRDHTPERYRDILLPALAAMEPAPKARLVQFGSGVHGYMKPEEGLPKGIGPAIAQLWQQAIDEGYYVH
ncbi:MAG: hypothetical protein ACHQ7M_09785 [Chloroflexota bacterium]